jgi:hypothetical protein
LPALRRGWRRCGNTIRQAEPQSSELIAEFGPASKTTRAERADIDVVPAHSGRAVV